MDDYLMLCATYALIGGAKRLCEREFWTFNASRGMEVIKHCREMIEKLPAVPTSRRSSALW